MTDHVKYELICMDNPITPDDDLDYYPLAAVGTGQLVHAHQVAIVLLAHRRSEGSKHEYIGLNSESIWLPECTADHAHVKLMLDDINASTVTAIAEIAAAMRCKLCPRTAARCTAGRRCANARCVASGIAACSADSKTLFQTACDERSVELLDASWGSGDGKVGSCAG